MRSEPFGSVPLVRVQHTNDPGLYFTAMNGNRLAVAGQPILPDHDLRRELQRAVDEGGDSALSILQSLDGVFAAILYEEESGAITVINDRLGLQPLYYAEAAGFVALATETFAVAAALEESVAPDPAGWSLFFRLGCLAEERTLVADVRRMPGASLWRFDRDGSYAKSRFWSLPPEGAASGGAADRFDALAVAVEREVAAYQQTFGPAALLLSGGFDSRFIAAALHRQQLSADAHIVAHPDIGNADGRLALALAKQLGIPARMHRMPADFYAGLAYERYLADTEISGPSFGLFIAQVADLITQMRPAAVWDGLALGYSMAGFSLQAESVAVYLSGIDRLPSATFWRAAQEIFEPHFFAAMQDGWREIDRQACEAYAPGRSGLQTFFLNARARRRIGVHTLKALANDTVPLTPGTSREFLERVYHVPLVERLEEETYRALFSGRYRVAGEVPIVSGAMFYGMQGENDWRLRWERIRAQLLGHWRVQPVLRRLGLKAPDSDAAQSLFLQGALESFGDDPHINADALARLRRDGLVSPPHQRQAEILGYWAAFSAALSRPEAF